jgi:hypothetical protein
MSEDQYKIQPRDQIRLTLTERFPVIAAKDGSFVGHAPSSTKRSSQTPDEAWTI